jgi:hypothetical protein
MYKQLRTSQLLKTFGDLNQWLSQHHRNHPEPDDDDYIEGKQFKSEINYLKRELNQFKQQAQSTSMEMQLRSKYPDFERVVSPDNINKFIQLKPELAESLRQTPDSYNKLITVYKRERADMNQNKPRVASSLKKTESALSHASEFSGSRLDESRKKEIWQQMQKNLRG